MAKKTWSTPQFDTLVSKEKDQNGMETEKTIREQREKEWEDKKFYWNLYKRREVEVDMETIRRELTGNIKIISQLE